MLPENSQTIFIIIPVFNRLAFTVACIKSLLQQTYTQYKIVVVDHGSQDGTSGYISTHFPEVALLEGEEHMWWTAATNMGLRYALRQGADYILTLNNDLVVSKDYLQQLMKAAGNGKDLIVGSVSVDIAFPHKVAYAGTLWSPWVAKYKPAANLSLAYPDLIRNREVIETDMLPGRGTLIPAAAFHTIGLFDEISFPHYAADEDFSLRAKKSGYRLVVSLRAVVHSHIRETGILKEKMSLSYLIKSFSSVKSPGNLKIRWRWALKHARTPAPVYFLFDFARLLKSTLSQ